MVVDLYCDDVLVDTQVLAAETGWKYTWYPAPVWKRLGQKADGPGSAVSIEGEHCWYVVEQKVSGYNTSYALGNSQSLVVTNTIQKKTH